jgi:CubicO group peptidase (beta-lactamase class C family)
MSRLSRRSFVRRCARLGVGGALAMLLSREARPVLATSPATARAASPVTAQTASPVTARAAPGLTARADADRIDGYVRERMGAWSIPGLSLALVEDGAVSLTRGYGLADREQQRPLTPQTPVAIGSATKPITATAIMQLVEAGAVGLDEPVTRYLPWFTLDDPRAAGITVRQILSHTSGIPASASLDGHQDADDLDRRVHALEWVKLASAPGERFEYANDGFNVAGLIVQAVSGVSYEQYVADKILAPLRMEHSTFDPARAADLGLAQGYVKRKGALLPQPTRLTRAYDPAGMLLSTAEDLGRWLAALASGGQLDGARVIGADSLAQMWTPAAHVSDDLEYGLGWFLSQQEGQRAVLHTGEILTMGSMVILLPDRKIGVAVLANLDVDGKDEIAEGVARLAIGLEPVLRAVPQTGAANTFVPDRAVWDQYVGSYETPQGALRIYREGDKLLGGIQSFTFELEPISDSQFVLHTEISSFDETVVEFRREADGTVTLYAKGQRLGVKR